MINDSTRFKTNNDIIEFSCWSFLTFFWGSRVGPEGPILLGSSLLRGALLLSRSVLSVASAVVCVVYGVAIFLGSRGCRVTISSCHKVQDDPRVCSIPWGPKWPASMLDSLRVSRMSRRSKWPVSLNSSWVCTMPRGSGWPASMHGMSRECMTSRVPRWGCEYARSCDPICVSIDFAAFFSFIWTYAMF